LSLPADGEDRVLAIGLMSGTSLDGMDAALVEVARQKQSGTYRFALRAFETQPYDERLRAEIAHAAHGGAIDVARLARLDAALASVAVRGVFSVCRRAHVATREVTVIGSHGQTVFHGPTAAEGRVTMQIASPARIAALTGITTVGDFRTADVAAGGEGAPLMPIVHRMLFSDPRRRRAVQNLGGIGNVTWLGRGGDEVLAFDTGPGVMVIDEVTRIATRGRQACDRDGRLASRGKPDRAILARLLRDPYFARRPPKSTGRERYGRGFAVRLAASAARRGLAATDLVATATAFTAHSIADQYRRFIVPRRGLDEVWLAGGGAHNPALVEMIASLLAPLPVGSIEEIGGHADGLEAVGFAILACAALDGVRFDLRSITGARTPVSLGVIAPGSRALPAAARGRMIEQRTG
jgi:anhydro-N-acetylmuramic acid kinase